MRPELGRSYITPQRSPPDLIGRRGVLLEVALGRKLFKPTGSTLDCCLAGMGFCRMWGLGNNYLSQRGRTPDLLGRQKIQQDVELGRKLFKPAREHP